MKRYTLGNSETIRNDSVVVRMRPRIDKGGGLFNFALNRRFRGWQAGGARTRKKLEAPTG